MIKVVNKGIVFDIQKFCTHDGPGIRTVVFLKGCPLRCKWCSNPESQAMKPEIVYNKSKCMGCLACVKTCSSGAIKFDSAARALSIDRNKCIRCFKCSDDCVTEAITVKGEEKSVDEVVNEVMKDEVFFRQSGGGVTVSGGEPLCQHDFAASILKAVKSRDINTAIETTGYGKWENLHKLLQYTDIVLYDIKHIDSHMHKEGTGVENSIILENLKRIVEMKKRVIVRIPVIPNFNMDEESIGNIIQHLKSLKISEVDLLPFHQLGKQKYNFLGLEYELKDLKPVEEENIEWIKNAFKKEGISLCIGG